MEDILTHIILLRIIIILIRRIIILRYHRGCRLRLIRLLISPIIIILIIIGPISR